MEIDPRENCLVAVGIVKRRSPGSKGGLYSLWVRKTKPGNSASAESNRSRYSWMWLACEPGAGSGEQGKRERGAGIVVRNPEIDNFHQK
jgi:hypothetical protein